MHSKKDLIADIARRTAAMQKLVREAYIRQAILAVEQDLEEVPYKIIHEGWKWLCDVFDNEYAEANSIYTSAPEHVWTNYKIMEAHDQQEVLMLRRALNKLRLRVISRERPLLFKSAQLRRVSSGSTKDSKKG